MALFSCIKRSGKTKRTVSKIVVVIIALILTLQIAINRYRTEQINMGSLYDISYTKLATAITDSRIWNDLYDGYKAQDKLPTSYIVNLTGNIVQFSSSPKMFPLTLGQNPYLIENKRLCEIGKDLTFLVMVHSATFHFERRQSMRDTWANKNVLIHNDIRIVFFLGIPETNDQQVLIDNESSLYQDIVQGNFKDSYHNLTHKAAMSVRWVVEHCLNTKIIVKIDDDVFIPVFQYIELARNVWSKQSRAIYCRNHVTTIRRDGKWKVDPENFKGLMKYPFRSCMGFVQVMTADMFPSLYAAAQETPFFWIDDIYFSGMLVERVGGVTFHTPKNLLLGENPTLKCFKPESNYSCDPFVGFARTKGFMRKIWRKYNLLYKELANKYTPSETNQSNLFNFSETN